MTQFSDRLNRRTAKMDSVRRFAESSCSSAFKMSSNMVAVMDIALAVSIFVILSLMVRLPIFIMITLVISIIFIISIIIMIDYRISKPILKDPWICIS